MIKENKDEQEIENLLADGSTWAIRKANRIRERIKKRELDWLNVKNQFGKSFAFTIFIAISCFPVLLVFH